MSRRNFLNALNSPAHESKKNSLNVLKNLNSTKMENKMSPQVEAVANEAVFGMQFNTRDAVRYVQRNGNVDQATAQSVVRRVMVFHKK
jgi:hypothetical protein